MAENNEIPADTAGTNPQEHGAAAATAEPADFYDAEVARFEAFLDRDPNEAFHRYGLTLIHSLPPQKQVELAQKMGFIPKTALDYYNLACLAIERQDVTAALGLLQQALKLDNEMEDAIYNLALCHERLGNKSEALNQWKKYLEIAEDEDSKEQVQAHLAELSA